MKKKLRTYKQWLADTKAVDRVVMFCNELSLSDEIKKTSRQLVEDMKERGYPETKQMISAAIYLASIACNKKTTQMQIEKVTNVSVTSIASNYKQIRRELNIYMIYEDGNSRIEKREVKK